MKLIQTKDFETVKRKYIEIIENTPEIEKHARWVYGKHPHDELLRSYIENGEMYLLMDGAHPVPGGGLSSRPVGGRPGG